MKKYIPSPAAIAQGVIMLALAGAIYKVTVQKFAPASVKQYLPTV